MKYQPIPNDEMAAIVNKEYERIITLCSSCANNTPGEKCSNCHYIRRSSIIGERKSFISSMHKPGSVRRSDSLVRPSEVTQARLMNDLTSSNNRKMTSSRHHKISQNSVASPYQSKLINF